ncbi:MAG TPA: hypothetical protein PKX87_03220 [Alphaproteobacteria bacterium]|nr:hypothetical protein [Alphaproteobacteria bacterium]
MKTKKVKTEFQEAGLGPSPAKEDSLKVFHISEILTLHTGVMLADTERQTPDGRTERFNSNVFPLARLAEFLTGVNMTNYRESDSPILIVSDERTELADPQSLSTQRQLYDPRALLTHADEARKALRKQPGLEWLAAIRFPENELEDIRKSDPESVPNFCRAWVHEMAQRYGEWHMLTPAKNLRPNSAPKPSVH